MFVTATYLIVGGITGQWTPALMHMVVTGFVDVIFIFGIIETHNGDEDDDMALSADDLED